MNNIPKHLLAIIAKSDQADIYGDTYTRESLIEIARDNPDKYLFKDDTLYVVCPITPVGVQPFGEYVSMECKYEKPTIE